MKINLAWCMNNLPYTQQMALAIFAALEVCKEEEFTKWANNWLSGKDRSYDSAQETAKFFDKAAHLSHQYCNSPELISQYVALQTAWAAENYATEKRIVPLVAGVIVDADQYNQEVHKTKIDLEKLAEKAKKIE